MNKVKHKSKVVKQTEEDAEFYRLDEFATLMRVSGRTVQRWIKQGNVKAWQPMPGGEYKIPKSELQRFK